MHLMNMCRQHMAVVQIVIVVEDVKVGGASTYCVPYCRWSFSAEFDGSDDHYLNDCDRERPHQRRLIEGRAGTLAVFSAISSITSISRSRSADDFFNRELSYSS